MKQIITIAENEFYNKNDDGEFVRTHELVFVWTEMAYSASLAGDMIRTPEVGQIRFLASDSQIKQIVASLLKYTDDEKI